MQKSILNPIVTFFKKQSSSTDKDIKKSIRILFIIKERNIYGTKSVSYGLVNSCEFVANVLRENNIEVKVIQVIDNNDIDREVFNYKPTHCFIEALWVVPEKFKELSKLHPNVNWYVRLHSMIPFLATEGISFQWLNEYMDLRKQGIKISIACNNKQVYDELSDLYKYVIYTPNMYKLNDEYFVNINAKSDIDAITGKNILNVGSFGALRILKNHVQQAIWAINVANEIGKTLYFHINVTEHETGEGIPLLKNLKSLFQNTRHKLVEHGWMPHDDFLQLVKQMDFGMQLSFTETYCIVAADFVYCGIPIIVSEEINFINKKSTVNISYPDEVNKSMYLCLNNSEIAKLNKQNLQLLNKSNEDAKREWLTFLNK